MNTYARSSEKSCATAVVRLLAASLAVLVIFTLSSVAVLAQCTLNGVTAPASCNLVGPLTINTYSDTAGNLTTTSGNTLSLVAYAGTNINSGTMEATNGGILTLATTQPINNNGGTIAAMGA